VDAGKIMSVTDMQLTSESSGKRTNVRRDVYVQETINQPRVVANVQGEPRIPRIRHRLQHPAERTAAAEAENHPAGVAQAVESL